MGNDHKIEISLLRQLLDYDARSGVLTWKARTRQHMPNDRIREAWNTRYAGKQAFAVEAQGYRAGRVLGVNLKGHRVAWAIHYGKWPCCEIDHINGDKTDNRLANLRDVSRAENRKNLRKQAHNKSGVNGVAVHRLGYQASIKVNGKDRHLGYFACLKDATRARRDAEARYGFHQNHGLA